MTRPTPVPWRPVAAAAALALTLAAAVWQAGAQLRPRAAARSAESAQRAASPTPPPDPAAPTGDAVVTAPAEASGDRPAPSGLPAGPGGMPPALRWMADDAAKPTLAAPHRPEPDGRASANAIGLAAPAFSHLLADTPGLGDLGESRRAALITAWRSLVEPLVAGDPAAFEAACLALGGEPGEPAQTQAASGSGESGDAPASGEAPPPRFLALYETLHALLADATLPLELASVRRVDPGDAAARMPRMRFAQGDGPQPAALPVAPPATAPATSPGSGGSGWDVPQGPLPIMKMVNSNDSGGVRTRSHIIRVPMDLAFPASAASDLLVEVWTPVYFPANAARPADAGAAFVFAWDARGRRWQPVALRIALVSDAARERDQTTPRR